MTFQDESPVVDDFVMEEEEDEDCFVKDEEDCFVKKEEEEEDCSVKKEEDCSVKKEEDCSVKEEEENEESAQDMWSLMRPEPRGDAFASLLAGDGGKECKVNAKFAAPWDLMAPKPYVPIARSRSSLSNDSLQLCTESLGCESCDGLLDSVSPSSASSSVISDAYLSEDEEIEFSFEEEEEDEDEEENDLAARSFPPPLPTLCASSAAHLRSFKKDGRFVLQSVKAPLQNFLHTYREGGRLQMHLVSTTEDDEDLAFPLESLQQNEIFPEEIEEVLPEDQAPQISSDIPEAHQSKPLAEDSRRNLCDSSIKCNKSPAVEFKVACSMSPEKSKAVDNESSNAKREIQEGKSSPKQSASCQNVYSGWRTEKAEQNSSVICQNWEKAQALPSYPLNQLKYAETVSMINVNFRVNDLGLGRCHDDANSLSVWENYPCIATSS